MGQHKLTQGRDPPTSPPPQGPPLPPLWRGGWSLVPHGELSLVLLLWGGSRCHLGCFGVLKINLGTVATGHGVWLEQGRVMV